MLIVDFVLVLLLWLGCGHHRPIGEFMLIELCCLHSLEC